MPDDFAAVRPPADSERLLTAAEAAGVLGVSERTVRRRIAAGKIPAIDAGGQMRVPASALGVRAPDAPDSPTAGPRWTAPAMPSATDPALLALIERQAQAIADLTGRLAVAEERLRQIGPGGDAPVDRLQPRSEAIGPDVAPEPATPPRRWPRLGWGHLVGLVLILAAVVTILTYIGLTADALAVTGQATLFNLQRLIRSAIVGGGGVVFASILLASITGTIVNAAVDRYRARWDGD